MPNILRRTFDAVFGSSPPAPTRNYLKELEEQVDQLTRQCRSLIRSNNETAEVVCELMTHVNEDVVEAYITELEKDPEGRADEIKRMRLMQTKCIAITASFRMTIAQAKQS